MFDLLPFRFLQFSTLCIGRLVFPQGPSCRAYVCSASRQTSSISWNRADFCRCWSRSWATYPTLCSRTAFWLLRCYLDVSSGVCHTVIFYEFLIFLRPCYTSDPLPFILRSVLKTSPQRLTKRAFHRVRYSASSSNFQHPLVSKL